MRTGQQMLRNKFPARPYFAAGVFFCFLLLDLVLALFAAPQSPRPVSAVSEAPAPRSFRSAAERTGNLAAMHDGAGTGVRVQMRGGRTSPTFARRLQSDAARLSPARVRESVSRGPERIASTAQTVLFQLFPRRFLPVRAGPVPA